MSFLQLFVNTKNKSAMDDIKQFIKKHPETYIYTINKFLFEEAFDADVMVDFETLETQEKKETVQEAKRVEKVTPAKKEIANLINIMRELLSSEKTSGSHLNSGLDAAIKLELLYGTTKHEIAHHYNVSMEAVRRRELALKRKRIDKSKQVEIFESDVVKYFIEEKKVSSFPKKYTNPVKDYVLKTTKNDSKATVHKTVAAVSSSVELITSSRKFSDDIKERMWEHYKNGGKVAVFCRENNIAVKTGQNFVSQKKITEQKKNQKL